MYDNESQEMYLETILKIQKRKGSVRSIEIAEEMGFSRPSVSRAVGIMKDDGFIVVKKRRTYRTYRKRQKKGGKRIFAPQYFNRRSRKNGA